MVECIIIKFMYIFRKKLKMFQIKLSYKWAHARNNSFYWTNETLLFKVSKQI